MLDKNIQIAVDKGEMLPLMEEFYTIQGEGYHTGTAAYFIRIGGCDVGCHWCDVKEIIYNVCDRLKEETKDHKITYAINENLPLFKLDYGLMEQIIYNLVYNCAQHTPKGATINISAKYEVDADYDTHIDLIKKCVITISDDGYGFPPEEIDKAFDKFYRFKTAKTGGTGLGLSIVKGFTEAQHGWITLHNADEGGAVFELSFVVDCLPINSLSHE